MSDELRAGHRGSESVSCQDCYFKGPHACDVVKTLDLLDAATARAEAAEAEVTMLDHYRPCEVCRQPGADHNDCTGDCTSLCCALDSCEETVESLQAQLLTQRSAVLDEVVEALEGGRSGFHRLKLQGVEEDWCEGVSEGYRFSAAIVRALGETS